MLNDQRSLEVTATAPAGRHGAVTRLPWAQRDLKWLFWLCAAVLAPWVGYLYLSEVPRGLAHQIRLMAAGLTFFVIAGLVLTAWTYRRGSPRSVITASFTAAAIFISAWFRTNTHSGGVNWPESTPLLVVVVVVVTVLCVIVIQGEFLAAPPARWLPAALSITALALVPYLVVDLTVVPAAQHAYRLKFAWAGLDVFEVLALACTGFALHRRAAVTAVPAAITGTLLLCDAWLNIVPATGPGLYEGIAMAFIELPLAALSFWVAARQPGSAERLL